jgi:ATP-binding cassette subfamily C protein
LSDRLLDLAIQSLCHLAVGGLLGRLARLCVLGWVLGCGLARGRRWRQRPLARPVCADGRQRLLGGFGLVGLFGLLFGRGLAGEGSVGRLASWVGAAFDVVGVPLNLISVLVCYVALIAGDAAVRRWQTVTYCSLQLDFSAALRKRLHDVVMRAGWVQLTRCRASDLTHALTGQIDRIGNGALILLVLARDGLLACVYLVATLYVSPVVTVVVASAGLVLMLLLARSARAASSLGQEMARASAEAYHAVSEHLGGIKMAKSYGAEERSTRLFSDVADAITSSGLRSVIAQADAKRRFNIGGAVVLGIVLYSAIAIFHTPAAVLLILIFAFARVMPLLSAVAQEIQQVLNMLPDFTALIALQRRLDALDEVHPARRESIRLRHAVRLESVSFHYEEAAEPALVTVSLTIPAGETTAIVGPSGAGKSTLADLLLGLITPARGRVLVDDVPLTRERLQAWRDQVGYVPQDSFHFHDTVRANLLWARPEASEAELREALAVAAADFVARLPQGLDTVLGDRGVRLSGGERQRIALARALVRRPAILILDEATSSLDSENERRVQDAIERLHGRLTILVITHRLTTVRRADSIHVLEGGRLVESGDWQALLNGSAGRFRAMCEAQGLPV